MMAQFSVRREDVISNFEYILRSEIPLTKRLINLMEAYKIYYLENTKIFNGLDRSLRMHLGQPMPEKIWVGAGRTRGVLDEGHPGRPWTPLSSDCKWFRTVKM